MKRYKLETRLDAVEFNAVDDQHAVARGLKIAREIRRNLALDRYGGRIVVTLSIRCWSTGSGDVVDVASVDSGGMIRAARAAK